jgi:phage tail sheath gpL-like
MALIPITGWPSNYRVPGSGIEIRFGQGPSTASPGTRQGIIVAPMLSTGTWTANTVYGPIKSEAEVIVGAGNGSPLHRAARAYLKRNKRPFYCLPYAATNGGTPATADLDVVVSGTPTATGKTQLVVCGEVCEAAFTTASTPTTIGDALEASVNAKTWLPVTATNTAGTVALAAKIAGQSQGDGTIPVIRVHCLVDSGKGVTFQSENSLADDFLGNTAATSGAEGSTTEATNLAAALAVIDASLYYYIATTTVHATEIGSLKTHVASKSEPTPGLRCVGLAAYSGALAAAQTLANGLNHERIQVGWQPNSEHDPAELVGALMAVRQKREETDPTFNFDSYRRFDWDIKRAWSEADWPDSDDLNDAINDGIAPIASDEAGSYFVMSVNTRSKNAAGTVDDFRATETHRPSGMDFYGATVQIRHGQDYGAKKLKDDERLADGSINANQRGSRNVVRPSVMKAWLFGIVDDMEEQEILIRTAETKEATDVTIDPNNNGRIEVGQSCFVINHHHQTTFRLDEAS